MSVSVYVSVCVTVYVCMYVSICLSVCLSVCLCNKHSFIFYFYLTACSVCRHLTKIGTTLARGKYGGVRAQSEMTILIFTYIVEYTIVLKVQYYHWGVCSLSAEC